MAEYLQKALLLPPDAVSYEWAGDTKPIASNATAKGRALNRRVEVEVWYDEPAVHVAEEEVLVQANLKQSEGLPRPGAVQDAIHGGAGAPRAT